MGHNHLTQNPKPHSRRTAKDAKPHSVQLLTCLQFRQHQSHAPVIQASKIYIPKISMVRCKSASVSIYLLLSIKCFHFKTTRPSSKRHLHAYSYTIQINSYLVQWLHILSNHSALCSQDLVSVIPWTLRKKSPTSPRIVVFRNIREGDGRAIAHQIICDLKLFITLVSAFLLQKKMPHCYQI